MLGGILAVLAFILVDNASHLGNWFAGVALAGVMFGAVLGLVPGASPGWRAGAFVIGYLQAIVAFALRAALLPDIPLGAALAALLAVAITAGICALTRGRMPLWAGLLGVGSFSAAYELAFETDPTTFLTVAPAIASALLLAVSVGFLVTVVMVELLPRQARVGAHVRTAGAAPAGVSAGVGPPAGGPPGTGPTPGTPPSGGAPGAGGVPAGVGSGSAAVGPPGAGGTGAPPGSPSSPATEPGVGLDIIPGVAPTREGGAN